MSLSARPLTIMRSSCGAAINRIEANRARQPGFSMFARIFAGAPTAIRADAGLVVAEVLASKHGQR